MNDVLRPYNSFFWVLYLNEIVVYSKSLEEHVQHLRLVLDKLRALAQLYLKRASKC